MATVERGGASHSGFSQWRANRPFWGGALLIVASLIIAYVPAQFAFELLLIGGAFTMIGLVFAFLVFLSGVAALLKPDLATLAGIAGIGFSVLSLVGALGGLLVGALLGLVGGSLCIAWESPTETERRRETSRTTSVATGDDFEWQGGSTAGRSSVSSVDDSSAPDIVDSGTSTGAGSGTGAEFDWQDDPTADSQPVSGVDDRPRERSDDDTDDVTSPESFGPGDDEDDESDSSYDTTLHESGGTTDDEPTFSWEEDPYAEDDNNET